jgi:WD40 repeat protein
MSTSWQTVSVFISSTFNDMHAERDYLVKRVFPELREWCEKRKLRLVDIDLRWGVTEEDATKHKNVVKVCLDRIDECRPFFLCFLGQRRGWVPEKGDVSKKTCETFKDLKGLLGNVSVTELEILHAAINPLNEKDRAQYSFFYLRDDSYLKDLPDDPPLIRKTYTNENILDLTERELADNELKIWREEKIPETGRPVHHYSATWNEKASTPELQIPLQCPSINPKNQHQWQNLWSREAGIDVRDLDIQKHKTYAKRARKFNNNLCRGRLGNFSCGGKPLNEIILDDLKQAIEERFPEHRELPEESDLQKELDQQEQFLQMNSEGFIKRTGDFNNLNNYVRGNSRNLFVLTAPGGIGKTMLLANWIDNYRQKPKGLDGALFYRFIGASDRSSTVDSVIRYLVRDMKENAGLFDDEIPADPDELRKVWPSVLEKIGKQQKTIIVIDAINQLESGLADLQWIPWQVPEGIKFVVSFKKKGEDAENLYKKIIDHPKVTVSHVLPFENTIDRKRLIDAYLNQYLKKLEKFQIEEIINAPGSENPLFLKILLSELRVFGAFVNLTDKIRRREYGDTPVSAFGEVLNRLENDPIYSPIPPTVAVPLLFGLLSHARHGLSEQELVSILLKELKRKNSGKPKKELGDTIRLFLRQMRPFLALREGRHDYFYESFRIAALERYEWKKDEITRRLPLQQSSEDWHKKLADYFESLPVWFIKKANISTNRRAAELPYHLAWAGKSNHLGDLILEYELLETIIFGIGPHAAIEDISLVLSPPILTRKWKSKGKIKGLSVIQRALKNSAHVIIQKPYQLPSQLVGRLLGAEDTIVKKFIRRINRITRQPWLRPIIPILSPADGALFRTLSNHTEEVTTMVVTSDGRYILSGSGEKTIKVWDLESGREIITLKGHTGWISAMALTSDDKYLISGCNDGSLKVWDIRYWRELFTLPGHKGKIEGILITPDNRRAVTWSESGKDSKDDSLKIWDIEYGIELISHDNFFKDKIRNVNKIILISDNRCIVSGLKDNLLKIWDLENDRELASLPGHTDHIDIIAVTSDYRRAVSGSRDHTLKVWDLESNRELASLPEHTDWIHDIALTSDCRLVVSPSDNTLKVWDLESFKLLHTLKGHTKAISHIAVTSDGKRAITSSQDLTLKLWDLEHGIEIQTFEGRHRVRFLFITSRRNKAITYEVDDSFIRIWKLEQGQESQFIEGHGDSINAIELTSDGRHAISASDDSTLKVWDVERGLVLHTLRGHKQGVNAVTISPDTGWIISASNDHTIKVWDFKRGVELRTLKEHSSSVNTLAVTSDNCKIISGSDDNTLIVWDLKTGTKLHTLTGHKKAVNTVVITPDNLRAVSGSDDETLKIWDLNTGRELHTLKGHSGGVSKAIVTSDGRKVFSWASPFFGPFYGMDTLIEWDPKTGNVLTGFDEHPEGVWDIAITPGGRRVVSAGIDPVLIVWSYSWGYWGIAGYLEGHTMEVATVVLTPDNQKAISGSQDNTIKVWDVKKYSIIAEFHCEGWINVLKYSPSLNSIIAGDQNGRIYILKIET